MVATARTAPGAIGKGLPMVQPLICYESLFPGFTRQARRRSGAKVNLIINISNDAWFGAGAGPRQHLNLASYRAIEEGLPMVRATPTGISAVIDAYGRIPPGASLPMGRMGAIETVIPPSLPSTLYSRWGEGLFLLLQLASAAMAWRLDGRRRLAETALTKNLGV